MLHTNRRSRLRFGLAGLTALSLALTACGTGDDNPEDPITKTASTPEEAPEPRLADESGETDNAESGPSEEADEAAEETPDEEGADQAEAAEESADAALPTKVIEAGKVSPGTTQSASGKSDALVVFEQSDAFAVVAGFECKECKGDIELQQLGSHDVLDTGEKSLAGRYLLDIIGSADEEQTLIVRADGEWDVTLRSWNDLPISSGDQQGKGAEVLYIGDETKAIEVEYAPPKGGGKISITATSAVEKDGETPKVVTISGGKKFTKKKDIKLPGVLTVSGKGDWKIKLIS